MARGWSQTVIAKTLAVSRITINKDVQWIKAKNRRLVTDHNNNQVVGDAIARYQSLESMALNEYSAAEAGSNERGNFLALAAKLRETQMKLLQNTGHLPKDGKSAGNEWSLTDGVDPNDISLEELKAIAQSASLKLMQDTKVSKEQLEGMLAEYDRGNNPKVIDVTVNEDK